MSLSFVSRMKRLPMTKLIRATLMRPYSLSFSFSLSLLRVRPIGAGRLREPILPEAGREAKPCTGGDPGVLGNPLPRGQAFAVVHECSLGESLSEFVAMSTANESVFGLGVGRSPARPNRAPGGDCVPLLHPRRPSRRRTD